MSLKSEILPYTDGLGYVAPALVGPGIMRASDNETMFTSEYYVLLALRGELEPGDADAWKALIRRCMRLPGLLVRSPADTSTDNGPDNMLGVLDASQRLNRPDIAQSILDYGYAHYGIFSGENPGSIYKSDNKSINWDGLLWRQLQLLAGALAAAKKLRWYHLPLTVYTALIILWTGLNNYALTDCDARRLTWHLVNIMAPSSLLCRLATKVWMWKLYKDFPGLGMLGIAQQYYQNSHPFREYFVSE